MDRELGEDTRLLYCTTGVLLQKLINDKNMHRFTHVILDEVTYLHLICISRVSMVDCLRVWIDVWCLWWMWILLRTWKVNTNLLCYTAVVAADDSVVILKWIKLCSYLLPLFFFFSCNRLSQMTQCRVISLGWLHDAMDCIACIVTQFCWWSWHGCYVQVHERDIDTDFCLLLVRKLLWSNSGDVKVCYHASRCATVRQTDIQLIALWDAFLWLLTSYRNENECWKFQTSQWCAVFS